MRKQSNWNTRCLRKRKLRKERHQRKTTINQRRVFPNQGRKIKDLRSNRGYINPFNQVGWKLTLSMLIRRINQELHTRLKIAILIRKAISKGNGRLVRKIKRMHKIRFNILNKVKSTGQCLIQLRISRMRWPATKSWRQLRVRVLPSHLQCAMQATLGIRVWKTATQGIEKLLFSSKLIRFQTWMHPHRLELLVRFRRCLPLDLMKLELELAGPTVRIPRRLRS